MTLNVNTHLGEYPIYIERNVLSRARELLSLADRRVCIVTDSGVPQHYIDKISAQCHAPLIFCFPCGEQHKTFDTLKELLAALLSHDFDRKDVIVALGGGVVTDLAGFAAATYMRGIDFYNIPTTLLSQVDASVGGKTAVDFDGYKNMIGAFWQPKAVLIDPLTLTTLPPRRISDGMAEVIKMALTNDAELFERLEREVTVAVDADGHTILPDAMDEIIAAALRIKIYVVEHDVREAGLRRVLNFGHTLGHAIESCGGLVERYHGECVALGMLPMCNPEVRARLVPVLKACNLPYQLDMTTDNDALLTALRHDKKAAGAKVHTVFVPFVGSFEIQDKTPEELIDQLTVTAALMAK